jgi:hypothetical protein
MINAHTHEDFFLNTDLPIKTQTLMWYLDQLNNSLGQFFESNEEHEEKYYDVYYRYKWLDQLIKRLRHDEYKKIEHISKTVKHMIKEKYEQ